MIWEYGGIYSDMDSIANKFSVDTIRPTDDAFFLVEMMGFPSQYWFAASPRHPIMYLSAKQALQTMAFRNDIADNKHLAKLTGPGATKVAIILFMQFAGVETNGYLKEGVYEGTQGRRVTVAGSKEMPNEWVIREMKTKKGNYAKMGMTHYHESRCVCVCSLSMRFCEISFVLISMFIIHSGVYSTSNTKIKTSDAWIRGIRCM